MISKKLFHPSGTSNRFLSDFIIRSEQFARPYVYFYDNTLNSDGSEDVLVLGGTDQADWSYPDNLWKRGADVPQSDDLTTVDKWQIVDNSVLYYTNPPADTSVWLEVATTAEEFGDTLTQPSVERAETAADVSVAAAAESATSASEAAASAASIDPTTLLHTVGDGGGDPEGYTTTELDAGQLDDRYYTETEIDTNIYTKTEVDTAVADRRKLYANEPTTITPDADSDYTLTAGENLYGRLLLVDGSWTGTNNIIVDTSIREFVVDNTAGTYTATIKTSAGTGIAILAGRIVTLYCDGTNVVVSVKQFDDGSFTPIITIVTNLDSVTTSVMLFSRVGNTVTCAGSLVIDPTATGSVVFRVTLPISSNLASNLDAAGVFTNPSNIVTGGINADIANDEALFTGDASTATGSTVRYTFQYIIK